MIYYAAKICDARENMGHREIRAKQNKKKWNKSVRFGGFI